MFRQDSGAIFERAKVAVDFSSCSETEDGDAYCSSSDVHSDYEQGVGSSPPSVSRASSADTDDVETGGKNGGGSSSSSIPPGTAASLRSVLLDRPGSGFPHLSTAASVVVPMYYLHDDPSLAIPLGLSTFALAARYFRTHRERDALRAEDARRRWRSLRRGNGGGAAYSSGADSGGEAGGAPSSSGDAAAALEVLARLPGGVGSRRAELLARAARDPRAVPKVLLELSRSARRRRLCAVPAAIAALGLFVLCWTTLMDAWPVVVLGLLLARDAYIHRRAESNLDRLADDLYALAMESAGAAAEADGAAGGIGFGEVCDVTSDLCGVSSPSSARAGGKSWAIAPLFDKLRERPGSAGGDRRAKTKREGSFNSPGTPQRSDGGRSARRRRKKVGAVGIVGVV